MTDCREKVLETIADPDFIQQGDLGELLAVRDYGDELELGRVVVVAYREVAANDGFILTAYVADRPSPRRKAVWKR